MSTVSSINKKIEQEKAEKLRKKQQKCAKELQKVLDKYNFHIQPLQKVTPRGTFLMYTLAENEKRTDKGSDSGANKGKGS